MSNSPDPHVQSEPGRASAEDGLVVLDGPNGVAVTMTAAAALGTGNSLLQAAAIAAAYDPGIDQGPAGNRIDPD